MLSYQSSISNMGKTCLVTGGSGALGTAILRLLAEDRMDFDLVKVVDMSFPEELKAVVELKATGGPKFQWIVCDITDRSQVFAAINDCDIVIHAASIVPAAPWNSRDRMWKVNVTGAENIVDACRECGVKGLVYISSFFVVGPNGRGHSAEYIDEDSPYDPHPRTFYGETKKVAEDYVLAANGHVHANGTNLATCSLRLAGMFGQTFLQCRFLYKRWSSSKSIDNFTPEEAKQSVVYVGNAAFAAVTAAKKIQEKADLVGGEAYFITDDTPPVDAARLYQLVFAPLGFSLSKRGHPYLFYLIYHLLYWLSVISAFLWKTKSTLTHPEVTKTSSVRFIVSSEKFRKHFNFKPKYSPENVWKKVHEYITRLAEMGFEKPIYDFEL